MAIDSKKIAKNSGLLYIRMLASMCITFYTSRIILQNLGIESYGVYNIVGGIAVLFSFLSNSLSSSTQRYLTFAIGKNDSNHVSRVFSAALISHVIIAIIIAILSEILGLWLLSNKLDIPIEKYNDALIVFQISIVSCIVTIINVPFNAIIIAEEKLNFFAAISFSETCLKLAVAFAITLFPDRLISYSLLLLILTVGILYSSYTFCRIKFPSYIRRRKLEGCNLLKEMFSFTGWHMMRNGAMMGVTQGNSIIVNIAGGPIANAAMGLYVQVSNGVSRFMSSMQFAFSPQITKNYSSDEVDKSLKLMSVSTKLSALIFFFLGVPIITNIDTLLSIWLTDIPDNTSIFCVTGLFCLYFESLSVPMDTVIMASGKIRRYEIISSVIWLCELPVAFIMISNGFEFQYILIIRALTAFVYVIYESIVIKALTPFNATKYLYSCIIKPLIVGTFCIFIIILYSHICNDEISMLLSSTLISSLLIGISSWFFVMNRAEREIASKIGKAIVGKIAGKKQL